MKRRFNNFISIENFSREEIFLILKITERMEKQIRIGINRKLLERRTLGILYENDHHSRLSFEIAMKKLGGNVVSYFSIDPVKNARIISGYCDVLAVRGEKEGTSELISEMVTKPVINAGEFHQDICKIIEILYSINKTHKTLENLNIGIFGDLKYNRFLHSLINILTLFNSKLYFISHDELQLPIEILKELNQNKIFFLESNNFESVVDKLDVLYHNGITSKEFINHNEYEKAESQFSIDENTLVGVNQNFILLSSQPNNMISKRLDNSKHSKYFMQNVCGIYVRQALLGLSLGAIKYEK